MNNRFSTVRSLMSFFAVFSVSFLSALVALSIASPSAFAQTEGDALRPRVTTAAKFDVSPPLRSMKALQTVLPKGADDKGTGPIDDTRHDPDPVIQTTFDAGIGSPRVIPPTTHSFNGINAPVGGGPTPPDPNGDIGPNHYVMMVNSRFQIFSRTGTSLFGPANINSLFAGFGGACQTENAGDPVVLYDQFADRWLLSQFTANGPTYFNCVAVSTTSDPTGSYYRYAFSTGTNFPDYPKYGVWGDAYLISTREFNGPFVGVGAYAINRAQVVAGNPTPIVVQFLLPPGGQPFRTGDGLLPPDVDGSALPPPGTPSTWVGTMDSGAQYGAPVDALNLFRFTVDFATPANSSFTFANQLPTAAFDSIFPCTGNGRACIPQPSTTVKVDILSYRQRPTFRLAYRNFGTHESMVTTQSVEATAGLAGMRWYEIRSPNASPIIHQQGTYAPDAVHRWMGSIAMDKQGNMALGYSVSDATAVFPGIRYTGRLVTDPLGTMPQGEATIIAGGGSQTSAGNRWGDYSSMNIDPLDDCTFWYTNQWYLTTSSSGWRTRVGSFTFPECRATIPRSRADFDGDGRTDLSVYRPSEGNWFLNRSTAGLRVQRWGLPGDIPIPGDFDGDGKTDIAVFRGDTDEANPDFFVVNSSNGTFAASSWGLPNDVPMSGDFDGDAKTDLTVFRPSESRWYILSSTGVVQTPLFGLPGDKPMVMDYEADGLANIAVFRPSDQIWYIAKPTGVPAQNFYAIRFGLATDTPVPADYDGNNSDDIAVFRASTGIWYILRPSGAVDATSFGLNGDVPVPGDYDGDGSDDIAVYRNGTWFIDRSTSGLVQFDFGLGSDQPIPKSYIP